MKLKAASMLIALLCAGALFADAVAIGRSRNGYPLIVPQVKNLVPASGFFVLPKRLAVTASEEFDLTPLAEVYARTVPGGTVERSGNVTLCRFEFSNTGVPKSPEGYTLSVTDSGILIRARDARGLFYGMQTLCMMLRHRDKAESLKCCRITDWPDLEMRGLFFQLHWVTPTPKNVDRLCHVIDVLGALKYNTLLIDFSDNFPYTDSPFIGRKNPFSRADVERIVAAARRNHMEVIPYLQLVSHANWMKSHKDWEKLKEPGANAFCLSNPELQPLIEKVVRETADLIKPRYFHIGLDELEQGGFPKCPKCRKANLEQLMLEHLLPIKRILADRGITPIIYQDQFFGFGEPAGQRSLSIKKIPEKLGTDTIINSWEYWHRPTGTRGMEIRRRGFKKLLYMSFAIDLDNSWRLPCLAKKMNALGNILAYWSKVPTTLDWPENALPGFYPSMVAQANYCWNASDTAFSRIPMDGAVLLRELLDGELPNAFRGNASSVALSGALNRTLVDDPVFPEFDAKTVAELQRIAACDPAKFELKTKNGVPLAIVLSGTKYDGFATVPVTIPVDTTATGASFLMTSAAFNTAALETSVYKLKYINIGALKIVYADGTTAELPLVFRKNINDWNSCIGGNACRLVARGNDRNGALFTLLAIDWSNPHPEKTIREIVFSSKADTFISPVLFAVSFSDTGSAPKGMPGEAKIAPPARRTPVRLRKAVSFRRGIPTGTVACGGRGGLKYRVVNDSQRGKVLELLLTDGSTFLSRVLADLPIESPRDFGSIVFDFKISAPLSVYRPDFFVMNRSASKTLGASGFYYEIDDNWHTVCIPRERFAPDGGGIDPKQAECVSVRFFMQEWRGSVSFRVSDISYADGVLPCRINVADPAK